MDSVISVIGNLLFDFIGLPFFDSASLQKMGAAMNDKNGRWSPYLAVVRPCLYRPKGTVGELVAFGDTFNCPHLTPHCRLWRKRHKLSWMELVAARLARLHDIFAKF